ncbi:Gfo/Idh/MocA family oxidoreductase [Amnibacterium sp. CER49]|uniref:Gfo/Idh/MocA family protein n=1 Tax=Amnibacterium sp. CER49 TaxID=3039161 RepID=UPI00244A9E9E|nr:Gfo/Idh/MocA family oxidoreductase [Amnibacterium sp. CER49]MDH2444887.1 Gfo/Idh/MocA family oxidoreductase [Amnibacterium sp. CER49]
MSTRIGVGLIGVGWMGRLHARAYRAVSEHYPELDALPVLVSAADEVQANVDEAVQRLGFARGTTDYREVLADPQVDVVSICAPNLLHRELALAAAAAGKPFWIEKPMGRDAGESADIHDAVERTGLVTCVGFNYRNAPAVQKARELIRSGALGRITTVQVRLLADYAADPRGALTWRFLRDRAGSGVLGDLLSHGVDLAQLLVGRVASVTAATETFIPERPRPSGAAASHFSAGAGAPGAVENEDWAAMLVRFGSGALGTFEASRVAVGPRAEYGVEVYGTQGSVRWSFMRLNELEVALGSGRVDQGFTTVMASAGFGDFARFQPGAGTSMGFDDLKTIEAAHFLRSVLTGEQRAPSVADGLATARVVAAAEASAVDGLWHEVPPPVGRTTFDR